MSAKLSTDDSCLVDLLLEHSTSTSQGMSSCFTESTSAEMRQRLNQVEQLLQQLNGYAVDEPAHDLVAKTLARCEERANIRANISPSDTLTAAS